MPRTSPLHHLQAQTGATFTTVAGRSLPVRYSTPAEEHNAARSDAGLFDLTHQGTIEVRGPQAAAALDYSLTGRASALELTRSHYSLLCREDGAVVEDLVVHRIAARKYLLVTNGQDPRGVAGELHARCSSFRATVTDQSLDWACLGVHGPRAECVLAACADAPLNVLGRDGVLRANLADRSILLTRNEFAGEDGFGVLCRTDDARTTWSVLIGVGATHGLLPVGLACRDVLRLERGTPIQGCELTADVTPYDAGLGGAVALDKAGQSFSGAALARLASEPPVRPLVGVVAGPRRRPRPGDALLDPESERPVGRVTSGALSPTLGHGIALAYVPAALSVPGQELLLRGRGRTEPAVVARLPFQRPTRHAPQRAR